ncbi:hypothetical protein [Arthrobacter sp. KNU40]
MMQVISDFRVKVKAELCEKWVLPLQHLTVMRGPMEDPAVS